MQNSIVPTVYTLARFKISGHLPTLQINLSDTKYKSLMGLIDVAIPHFDEDSQAPATPRPAIAHEKSSAFRLRSGFFKPSETEYHLDDDDHDKAHASVVPSSSTDDDLFFEAETGTDNEVREFCLRCSSLPL